TRKRRPQPDIHVGSYS
ncbi:nucleoside transporter, partial [Histoplasma capsulatum]